MNIILGTHWTLREPGGVQSHLMNLARIMSKKGHQCVIVRPSDRFLSIWWKVYSTLKHLGNTDRGRIDLTFRRMADAKRTLEQILEENNFHLIHAHDVFFMRVSMDALHNKSYVKPKVLTVHGPLWHEVRMLMGNRSPRFSAFVRAVEEEAYNAADVIITVDSNLRKTLVEEYGVPYAKLRVIHNGVDTDWFTPGDGQKTQTPSFLVPRRLVPKNGVPVAVEAFSRIARPGVELWIAGDGPQRPLIETLIQRYKLQGQVRLLGAVGAETMLELMRKAWGVIVPSVPAEGVIEATSIAALEAMSTAKPVFASAIGGLKEIIRHGETGFLFPAGDADALANLLEEAMNRPETLTEMGQRARAYVLEHHSLPVWFRRIQAVYREVLGHEQTGNAPSEHPDPDA